MLQRGNDKLHGPVQVFGAKVDFPKPGIVLAAPNLVYADPAVGSPRVVGVDGDYRAF